MAERRPEMIRSNDELKLRSNSIVIKNSSLDREYRGGLKAFHKKFRPQKVKGKISVFAFVGFKAKKIIESLPDRHFDYSRDFVFVDIDLFSHGDNSKPFPPDPEVNWLKAHYENGTVFISFI